MATTAGFPCALARGMPFDKFASQQSSFAFGSVLLMLNGERLGHVLPQEGVQPCQVQEHV